MTVLDASALLTLFFREPGHEKVTSVLAESSMSTVNLAEVLARFTRDGHSSLQVLSLLRASPIEWVAFDADQAALVADLVPRTRHLGLSLGDRACLALASTMGAPAMTADEAWTKLDLGVEVQLLR
jgi:ribonuclease VapC